MIVIKVISYNADIKLSSITLHDSEWRCAIDKAINRLYGDGSFFLPNPAFEKDLDLNFKIFGRAYKPLLIPNSFECLCDEVSVEVIKIEDLRT